MIFISYRREGSTIYAGLLEEKLAAHFGEDKIFIDRSSIEIGEDFERKILDALSKCEVLLAIIGKTWLDNRETGRAPRWPPLSRRKALRRIDAPEDYIRREIATALKRDITVIPVLVEGANMPKPEDLPEDLKALSHCNGVILSDLHLKEGIAHLIPELQRAIDEAPERRRKRQLDAEESQRQEESKRKAAAEAEKIRRDTELREQQISYTRTTLSLKNWALRFVLVITIVGIYKVIPQPAKDYGWQLVGKVTGKTAAPKPAAPKPFKFPNFATSTPTPLRVPTLATPTPTPTPTSTPLRFPQAADIPGGIDQSSFLKPKPSPQPSPLHPPFERYGMKFVWVARGNSGFYLAGVTNAAWIKVMGKSLYPNSQSSPYFPLWNVADHDAKRFIKKLKQMDQDYGYRLPTKAGKEGNFGFLEVIAIPRPNPSLLSN